MNKKKVAVFVLLVVCALGGFGAYKYLNRFIYNSAAALGNTPGNLNNSGLFCEYGGKVYFSNPLDKGRLYVMNPDETGVKKLDDDTVYSINVYGNYIYYAKNNARVDNGSNFGFLNQGSSGLCRVTLAGKQKAHLDIDPSMKAALVGNYVYYLHYDEKEATTLYSVKIDGKEKGQVDKLPYNTAGVAPQAIYFNGLDGDHNVYRMTVPGNGKSLVYEGNCWNCVEQGGELYFMDCDNGYALTKVNPATREKKILADERVELYNIAGNYIYYQNNAGDNSALCRVRIDGTGREELMRGTFTNINVTSRYVYFQKFGQETPVYKVAVGGSGNVEVFEPEVER